MLFLARKAMGPVSLPAATGDAAVRQKMGPIWISVRFHYYILYVIR